MPTPLQKKGSARIEIVEHKIEKLAAFPGDGVAVERQPVDRGVGQQRAGRETGAGQPIDVGIGRLRLAEAEECAAGAEAEQRQAHHQEGEVVVLRHGQQPGQRAFEEERGRGQRRDAEGSTAKHPLTIIRQGVYAAGRSYRKECSFVSLAIGRFSLPGIPHAADQRVTDPDVISIKNCLEDQLDLFGGQQPPAEGIHDDAEGTLDVKTQLLSLFASKLVIEKHPIGRLEACELDGGTLTDV